MIIFTFLTFVSTWLLWFGIVVANHFGYLDYGTPVMMILYVIGGLMPTIVSIGITLRTKKISFKKLFRMIFQVKQPVKLYIAVLLSAYLPSFIFYGLGKAEVIAPLYMSILIIPFMVIGGGLEEIGWRMILQPALEKKLPFVLATLVTGIIWALWHLPLFYMEGTNQFSWNFGVFAIQVLGMAFVLAVIRKTSKGVWLCILFHSMSNAIGEAIQIEQNWITALVSVGIFILFGVLILSLDKKKKIVKYPRRLQSKTGFPKN